VQGVILPTSSQAGRGVVMHLTWVKFAANIQKPEHNGMGGCAATVAPQECGRPVAAATLRQCPQRRTFARGSAVNPGDGDNGKATFELHLQVLFLQMEVELEDSASAGTVDVKDLWDILDCHRNSTSQYFRTINNDTEKWTYDVCKDSLRCLVARVPNCKPRGPGFDSRRYKIF
jgi:hypothetical protein